MSCWNMLLLLLLWTVMLSSRAQAQSGEVDTDMVPTMSCTSHISLYEGSNISCQLIPRGYDLDDDEDEDPDTIHKMTACCCELWENTKRCVEVFGDTLSSKDLNPVSLITLTALSKRGYHVESSIDLKKIIKPKSPQVYNVTLNPDQALVHVHIPYYKDYLKEDNLHFQLQLWSKKTNQTQNMTSSLMNIGSNHLRSGTEYHVKARAIPWGYFQGTWSEWSQPYTFHTPPGETPENPYFLLWSILPVAVVVVSVAFIWKNKILTYMWPSIPHPKTTLVQICGPNNGPLLLYIPEEFSSLNVYTSVSQSAGPSCNETEPALSSPGTNKPPSCSTQSTDTSMSTSSMVTEELELLSQSSTSEEEQDVPSDGLLIENTGPHLEAPETPPAEHNGTQHDRDDSYVTMSSFYQIKTARTGDRTVPVNLIMT